MSLRLPFWSSSYICCRLTTALMSLPIYQLRFGSSLVLDKSELHITLSNF
ncbi:hypothetical protein F383_31319 [Gossypium arboreum]|uniref:Uncharacterized protein n=1 Tax=Gossypium arboreum TaxID=29729 RepID=A0A0B0MYE1_GOSAR|nr:hypothetical protein F383_31319 [Gossypium arboreum]